MYLLLFTPSIGCQICIPSPPPRPWLLVWGECFLSCWNGQTMDHHPRSASAWGCHCNSPQQERGNQGREARRPEDPRALRHSPHRPPSSTVPAQSNRGYWIMTWDSWALVPALLLTSSLLVCKIGLILPTMLALLVTHRKGPYESTDMKIRNAY